MQAMNNQNGEPAQGSTDCNDLLQNIAGLDDRIFFISSHAVLVQAVKEWRAEARALRESPAPRAHSPHEPPPPFPAALSRSADEIDIEGATIIVAGRLRALGALKDDYGQIQHQKVQEALSSIWRARPPSPAEIEKKPADFSSINEALKVANLEYSVFSTSGVVIYGDQKSIQAAAEAFHSHSIVDSLNTQIRHWREECGKLHARTQPESEQQNCARLAASEYACYRWPGDTTEHSAMRAAFMDGAAHAIQKASGEVVQTQDDLGDLLHAAEEAKRRALNLADERAKEAVDLRAKLDRFTSIWSEIAPGTKEAIRQEHHMLVEVLDELAIPSTDRSEA